MMLEGTLSPISVGGLQRKDTNPTRITMSPRLGNLNEWRRTESAVVEGRYALSEPKRYHCKSPRFGRLNKRRRAETVAIEKDDTHQIHPKEQYHHGSAA